MAECNTDVADTSIWEEQLKGQVPSYAFDPNDVWTRTFRQGLLKAELRGKTVYEVGVGTGINIAFMLQRCGIAQAIGSDLDPRLTELATRIVESLVPDASSRFLTVPGSVSLLESDEAKAYGKDVDVIVGCLPQVGDPSDARCAAFVKAIVPGPASKLDKRIPDHYAHYYPWAQFDGYPFNVVGLGLNEALLRQARNMAPQADVILNFGGRIGQEVILDLFEANDYSPEVLYSTIVPQSRDTDITFYVALERAIRDTAVESAFSCEFFADPQGHRRLTAQEAWTRLCEDPHVPLYHSILVVRGRPELS